MHRNSTRTSVLGIIAVGLSLPAMAAEETAPDFNRDVRPILSQHCFKCHGPDDAKREAKLRFDLRAIATRPADSGERPIVPGKPSESEMIRRITSPDEYEVMPPPAANLDLSAEQKGILTRWVAAGAEYDEHWSFVPPMRPELPSVRNTDWPINPIDRFILSRIEAAGLSPSPPADRHALVRRVYLDLIGLPPTPVEADAFVNDASPDAYEKLVDQLLASPHYGERWAREWLDLARYADTNGYEKDRERSMWPYRDWVINALNDDMPFDRFTIEQLAGDMLPDATVDQKIATGFHRNTMLNEEGGIDPLEFRFHAMTDRVATTGTVWLGLTIGCAQCHTHKFDPITQREYYSFMALMNNADEPKLSLPRPEISQEQETIDARIAHLESLLAEKFPSRSEWEAMQQAEEGTDAIAAPAKPVRNDESLRNDESDDGPTYLEESFQEWLTRERAEAVEWQILMPTAATSNLPRLSIEPDGSVFSSGDVTKRDTYDVSYRVQQYGVTGLRLEALPDARLPAGGPGRAYYEGPEGDFFLSELKVIADGLDVKLTEPGSSYAQAWIGGKAPTGAEAVVDGMPHTGWSAFGNQHDRSVLVATFAEPINSIGLLSVHMLFDRHYPAALGRFRISVTTETDKPLRAKGYPNDVEQLLLRPDNALTEDDVQALRTHYLSIAPQLAEARKEIDKLRQQRPTLPTTLVMRERPADDLRTTHVHKRGEFTRPTDPVSPGVPSVLHDVDATHGASRLELARWLVDPSNPLVGRVTMNRHWANIFGRGIVKTTEDFGYQGSPPSHPELLDWLAVEFIERGWSVKQMHRLMVTSATYRQSSRVSPELLKADPQNVLLAHAPRFRLDAELIRDSVLTSSGLLSRRIGGPSVFPPQPESVASEDGYRSFQWEVSEGEDRYRRGLYTFQKRTSPFAMFSTFDAPSGEMCVVRRERSNTPLQALTLLNDTVFVEAAQRLGMLIDDSDGTVDDRMITLFRRVLIRPPREEEIAPLTAFYDEQLGRLTAGELNAAEIVECDAEAECETMNQRAAWTLVARALLNLDETITKD